MFGARFKALCSYYHFYIIFSSFLLMQVKMAITKKRSNTVQMNDLFDLRFATPTRVPLSYGPMNNTIRFDCHALQSRN